MTNRKVKEWLATRDYPSRFGSRRRGSGSAIALTSVLLGAGIVCAQDSQFLFDLSGNLQAQMLEVPALPQIIGQPQMQVVIPGNNASFSVGVADTSGVSYQWFFNSSAIPGATADSLLLTNVGTANEGPYWVAVSNVFGSVASVLANLCIDSRGCGMPDSWQLQYFGNLNQPATGDYDGDGVSNLQEFLDGTNPTNAASALYRISLLNDGGSVVISPDQATYTHGQIVTLVATSTNSNPFHAWTGDVVTRSNSITVTMTTNLALFAHFMPFTLEWTNYLGGDWNAAANWSPNLVPSSNESVLIGTTDAIITENSNVDLVNFTFGDVGYTPTLTGSGQITISGSGSWNTGTMSGTGSTVVQPGASLSLPNIPGVVLTLNRTLENAGSVAWGGGNFALGGVITNDAGAQFQMGNPASFNFGGGTPRFDNVGTLTLADNAITTFAGAAFNDYGTVDFPGGTLTLSAGGVLAGPLVVPAGSALEFQGGVYTSRTNLSITGGGMLWVNANSATFSGVVNVTGTNIFGPVSGSTEFAGNYICTNNVLTISGGAVSFDGTAIVSPSVINLSNGSLGGSNLVTVGNAMTWTGGSMLGTGRTLIPAGVTLNINNASPIFITSRTLDNAGTTTWSGAGLSMTGGVITNEPGALFQVQSPTSIAGTGRFDNAGTCNTLSSGMTSFNVAVNNYNTVGIQGGTLELGGGGLDTGSISVPAGAGINFGGGTFTSSPGSTIAGGGALIVSGGTPTFSGVVNLGGSNTFNNGVTELNGGYVCANNVLTISGGSVNFDGTGQVSPALINLSNGLLGGSNAVTVGSAMTWTGGSMGGTGRTTIPPGTTLNINNSSAIFITSRTLENGGTTTWTGAGVISLNNCVITNRVGALFNAANAAPIQWLGGSPHVDNAGTFRKSVGTGTTTISGSVAFTNYGTVDIQSGIVAMNGGFTSVSNALLNCAIGGKTPGTTYGQLQVSGTVVLNGSLSVNLTNGYFPTANDSFTLVSAGTRINTFASFNYPSNIMAMQLSNTAASVIAQVTGVVSVQQPVLTQPAISASNILLTWTASSNFIYRLEYNPALSASNWNAIPGDVTTSSNTASKFDSLTSTNRFYRVQVLP